MFRIYWTRATQFLVVDLNLQGLRSLMSVAAAFIDSDARSQALDLSLETIFLRPMIVESMTLFQVSA